MNAPIHNLDQQLSRQLHLVSEIAEALTLRFLSLEEQLKQLSGRLESLDSQSSDDSESFELLSDSNNRLVQLRGLLNEVSSSDPVPLEVVKNFEHDSDSLSVQSDDFADQQMIDVNDSDERLMDDLEKGNYEINDESEDLLSAWCIGRT